MRFRKALFLMSIVLLTSCANYPSNESIDCSADNLDSLKVRAWEADRNSNEVVARTTFERICSCLDVEGCINASSYYSFGDPSWRSLNEQACDLENGNACFLIGESTNTDIAKGYYEKGCLLSVENASGASCRMAGYNNLDDYEEAASYFERGCFLEDIKSCIEAYKIIQEPVRRRHIEKLSCDIGIPEICNTRIKSSR